VENTVINNCTGALEYGDIIYYSHLIPVTISLILIFFILKKSKFSLISIILLSFLSSFSIWLIFDTVTWVSIDQSLIKSFWIPLDLINLIFFNFAAYFFTILVIKKDISGYVKILMLIILLPIFLLTITGNSVTNFNIDTCEAINNNFSTIYKFIIELLIISYIIYMTKYSYRNNILETRENQIWLVSLSMTTFLLIFSITEFISSITGVYEINLYSLLISPLFLLIIVYAITDLKMIEIDTIGTQIISYIMTSLIIAQMLLNDVNIKNILSIVTIMVLLSFIALFIYTSKQEEAVLLKSFILEKKALRELEKFSETKDRFIMIAQHNLHIPISTIQNRMTQTINRNSLNQNTINDFNDIQISINHLNDIAEDFKNIAQLKIGSNILDLSSVNLVDIIKNILLELKIDIENMKLKIDFPIDKTPWPFIYADKNKIREVFIVIIENAIKYNVMNGNITLQANTKEENLIIKIKSTGVGITSEENKSISSRSFYRSSRVKNLNPTGMGIGLSLSKTIIESHHGTLHISSEGENHGAIVTITLPINFTKDINKKYQ
jgi:signal transduction histidine kinase